MRHELFNQDIVLQEYLTLETNETDQMDETLPYTEEFFFNSLGLEQVDENNSPYLDVQNNSLEVNTPHCKQKITTRVGREVQKPKHLSDFKV
jgi:hypothetical protein